VALRVGQVIVPVVDAKHLDTMSDLVGRGLVGGLVVVGSPDAGIVSDLADLQALAAVTPLMVAVDEEGGTVQRMADLLGTLPSARRLVDLPTGAVWSLVAGRAAALADLGFTVDLAPVLDVGGGPGIGSRSFSDDPEIVADYGNAFAGGLLAGGLTPVAKHFPGHGRADADSHDVLPVTPPLDDLRNLDLVPWRALPEGTAVMVGHLNVPGLTGGLPASLSAAAITDLLRAELGFDGPVITDDLSMGAVVEVTDVARAAVQSLGAGADLLMVGSIEEVVPSAWALIAALDEGIVGMDRLDEAVGRGFVLRGVDPCGL
jgi:beta-N-acetylhexosaminidase